VTGLTIAPHTLSATYSGDANYAAAGPVSVTLTVTAAVLATAKPNLTSLINPATNCKSVAFSITVAGTGNVLPTGKVSLKKGSTVLATATLNGGKATVSTSALTLGKNVLDASYAGDAKYGAATSAAVTQTIVASCPLQPLQ
jgi:hypothetical protein